MDSSRLGASVGSLSTAEGGEQATDLLIHFLLGGAEKRNPRASALNRPLPSAPRSTVPSGLMRSRLLPALKRRAVFSVSLRDKSVPEFPKGIRLHSAGMF